MRESTSTIEQALIAAQGGDITKVKQYLKHGSVHDSGNILATNKLKIEGATLLHEAAANGQINLMLELIDQGAIIGTQTKQGWTALHAATFNSQREASILLVQRGADPYLPDFEGYSPIDGAKSKELNDLVVDLQTQRAAFLKDKASTTSIATEFELEFSELKKALETFLIRMDRLQAQLLKLEKSVSTILSDEKNSGTSQAKFFS